MSLLTLARRRTQIELLADVCERHRSARIALRGPGASPTTIETTLLALESDAIWVAWPSGESAQAAQPGCSAEVYFDHQGRKFAFTSRTCGRFQRTFDTLGERAALKLSLPTRIDHRQQRQSCRISLAALAPIQARLTSMLDADRELDCRLLNLSHGGIAAQAHWNTIASLAIGEVFWIEFDLPNVSERFEFAVRLAHRRRSEDRLRGIVGWAFCGGDDQMNNYDKLERISQAVASMQPEQPDANRPRAGTSKQSRAE